jgi:hypothetical protein
MERINVHNIIAAFPSPSSIHGPQYDPAGYCVGGALCLLMWDQGRLHSSQVRRFPSYVTLKEALQVANPALIDAGKRAWEIIAANDIEMYGFAWRLLSLALNAETKSKVDSHGRLESRS